MTNPFIERLKQTNRSAMHSHGPTPAEIQRWEDDGGAAFPDNPRQHAWGRRREAEPELAAA